MEKRIKSRYNQAILNEAMRRFNISEDKIQELDGFESFMYEFERPDGEYILRIGHSLRRSEALIQGEVDWINYLAAGGASVSKAIQSKDGKLVEHLDDGQRAYFLATAFERANGTPPWEVGWSTALYQKYGQLLGKMHSLSKVYKPKKLAWKRPEWDDPIIQDIEANLPTSEMVVLEKYHDVFDHLKTLPKDTHSYGLIHFDAHGANLLIDQSGNLSLFDFDDCSYGWYVYDIAIVLFYIAMWEKDTQSFTQEFLSHFFTGYKQANQLDTLWLKEIHWFLKLREIDLYAVIHRSFDVDNLDDPWCANYMQGRKEKIETNVAYLDFDFETLADLL